MGDILRGDYLSQNVRKVDKKIIETDIDAISNNLLTVFEDEVKVFESQK